MPAAAAAKEYFTDVEIDYIRDAQGLPARVTALLRLANIRLVTLGMKEKSKEDKALEKAIAELHEELAGKPATKPGNKSKSEPVEIGGPYLMDLSRTELLRGYIEAVDEITGEIDDAYRQKLEVRGALEQLEKFCSSSVPLLRRFQSQNAAELQAIGDARSLTQETLENTEDALKKVPRTEKSQKP